MVRGTVRAASTLFIAIMLTVTMLPPAMSSPGSTDQGSVSQASEDGVHLMTAAEVEELKMVLGVRDLQKDYNVLYGDQGTGYAPPTEEEYAAMVGKVVVRDGLFGAMANPSSMDLSTDPRFPAVGNQGNVGSCAAWAMAYYCYGYLEAKDNGWTDASAGNVQHLISPSWCYNKVNRGIDKGSWMGDVGNVLCTWGGATMSTMPYIGTGSSDSRFLDWGGEAAFREAPLHRALTVERITLDLDDFTSTLDEIRSVVSSGTPVTFALNADVLSGSAGDKIITSTEYIYGDLNHAQTIVGYDDTMFTNGESGAFKVVNSWGASFWGSGYYWMTYDAFEKIGSDNQLVYITDRVDYSPSLLGVWHYSSPQRQDGSITVTTQGGTDEVVGAYLHSTEDLPAFLCLDQSDLKGELDAGMRTFQLTSESDVPGTLSSYRTELYSGSYVPGCPTQVSAASPDVPTSNIIEVRSALPDYLPSSLATALDCESLNFATSGNVMWTASVAAFTRGGISAQSGDVASSSRSVLNVTLEGVGTLAFDWRMDCPASSDTLTFEVNGATYSVLSGSAPWAHVSCDVAGARTELLWSFLRQGNGGGCAFIDNVTWSRGDIHIDSDAELVATADAMGWEGAGTDEDPYIIEGYTIDDVVNPDAIYIGNTTLPLVVTGFELSGADLVGQAGIRLYNVASAEVSNCSIHDNDLGVVLEDCSDVVLRALHITGSVTNAVRVLGGDAILITGNNISDNAEGLRVDSSEVTAYDNLFRSNTGRAVRSTSSPASLYYGNVFIANNGTTASYDASLPQASDGSAASWNHYGYGNYWSDLSGPDSDHNGIVDHPYPLGGAADHAPTVSFVSEPWSLTADRTGTDAELDWNAPNRTFYSTINWYEISRTSASGTVSFATTGLSLLDDDPKTFGEYTYKVRAVTELGPGPWSTPAVIEVPDLIPPTISILAPSAGAWLRTTTVTITWSGTDVGTGIAYYEVSLDGGSFLGVGTATSWTASSLGPGNHQATVRATDDSSNQATDTVAFSLDLWAPVISILSPTAGSVLSSSSVTVTVTVGDPGSGSHRDLIRVDGQVVKDSSNVNTISFTLSLEDGVHRVSVTSTDRAGNIATASLLFTMDSAGPAIAIASPIEGSLVTSSDVVVEWNASDAVGLVGVHMSVDGGSWEGVSGPNATLRSLLDGPHAVVLRATDLMGRTATAWLNFTVDTAPLTAAIQVSEDLALDGPVVVLFSKQVNISSLQLSLPFDAATFWQGNDLVIVPATRLAPQHVYGLTVSICDLDGVSSGQLGLLFRTTGNGTVSGVVLDSSGNPVEGASVTAPDGRSVLTDRNGTFSLVLPFGSVQLQVHKAGYGDTTWVVDVAAGEMTSVGSKQLSPAGSIDQYLLPMAVVALVVAAVVVAIAVARRRR